MSSPRGRALIISNSSNRVGSEVDFRNVKDMLSKLDFVVTGEHKDYTAEVSIDQGYLCNTSV